MPVQQAPQRKAVRRAVIAFLVLVGLAGILAVSAPGEGTGSPPSPKMATTSDR